jgi:hypothetical protein
MCIFYLLDVEDGTQMCVFHTHLNSCSLPSVNDVWNYLNVWSGSIMISPRQINIIWWQPNKASYSQPLITVINNSNNNIVILVIIIIIIMNKIINEIKIKLSCYCHAYDKGERMYSSFSFLTLALDGGEWSLSHSGHTNHWENNPWYWLDRRLGGPQSWSEHRGYRKNPCICQGLNPSHPVVRHYTGWVIPALLS